VGLATLAALLSTAAAATAQTLTVAADASGRNAGWEQTTITVACTATDPANVNSVRITRCSAGPSHFPISAELCTKRCLGPQYAYATGLAALHGPFELCVSAVSVGQSFAACTPFVNIPLDNAGHWGARIAYTAGTRVL
jgi:hypothetical protein